MSWCLNISVKLTFTNLLQSPVRVFFYCTLVNTDMNLQKSDFKSSFNPPSPFAPGVFTAPVRGLYFFSFSVTDYLKGYTGVFLHRNEQPAIFNLGLNDHGGYASMSNGVVLALEEGDMIRLRLPASYRLYDDSRNFSVFSGFLLFPVWYNHFWIRIRLRCHVLNNALVTNTVDFTLKGFGTSCVITDPMWGKQILLWDSSGSRNTLDIFTVYWFIWLTDQTSTNQQPTNCSEDCLTPDRLWPLTFQCFSNIIKTFIIQHNWDFTQINTNILYCSFKK